ncbi:MAG: hypothetical protein M3442_04050, partial [Chloroflexota bacterium]|nr:hypothetical protein [Chloroflexota bacterium]
MDEADLIILVATPELAALRNAARFLRLVAQLGIPSEKVLLVANRADAGRQITPDVLEEHLLQPVAMAIPHDGKVPVECMNAGELLVTAYPRSRVAVGLHTLARQVAGQFGWQPQGQARGLQQTPTGLQQTPAPAGGSLFQRLLRRWIPAGRIAPHQGLPKDRPVVSDQVPAS